MDDDDQLTDEARVRFLVKLHRRLSDLSTVTDPDKALKIMVWLDKTGAHLEELRDEMPWLFDGLDED